MARALIRCISRLNNLSSPHFTHLHSSSYAHSPSIAHQISSYFDHQNFERSHLYQIHALLITSNRIQNPFFGSKLLKLSSQYEDLRYTLRVFYCISFPDIVCVNTVIKAFNISLEPLKGVSFCFEMLKCDVIFPNSYTFPPLIGCCAKSGNVRVGEMCHGLVIKSGFDCVMEIENCLIHMYACCGVIEVALKVFVEMLVRDVVSWNSMLDGYVKAGDLRTAHEVFDVMPERNVVSWNVMMSGHLEGGNPGCVLKLFRKMIWGGMFGTGVTFVSVITACGRSARLKEGASVHGFLVRRLWKFNLIVSTALIDMYSKCGKVEVARRIFDGISEKNMVCWNTMILGHCLHGNPNDGLKLFDNMLSQMKLDNETVVNEDLLVNARQRVLPDEITYVGVLCACTRAGLLEEGRIYFDEMVNLFGVKPNFAHYWCMANLLASKGLVQEALDTVRKVDEYVIDASSECLVWASLLGSCRFQGDASRAEQVAKTLVQLEPNNTMCYELLLNIYAAAGRWEDAAKVKDLLKKRVTGKKAGCSLVDLIAIVHKFRVGDAKQFGMEIVAMMDELALKLRDSDPHLAQHSTSATEWLRFVSSLYA